MSEKLEATEKRLGEMTPDPIEKALKELREGYWRDINDRVGPDVEAFARRVLEELVAAHAEELRLLREFHSHAAETWVCLSGGAGNDPCRLPSMPGRDEICMAHYAWRVRDNIRSLASRTHYKGFRQEILMQAASEICELCRNGVELYRHSYLGWLVHRGDDGWKTCDAEAIRALAWSEPKP